MSQTMRIFVYIFIQLSLVTTSHQSLEIHNRAVNNTATTATHVDSAVTGNTATTAKHVQNTVTQITTTTATHNTAKPTVVVSTLINSAATKNNKTACVNDPADIVFLVDRSGSVGKANFRVGLNFIKEFALHYTLGSSNVQIGVMTFSGDTTNEFNMNHYHDHKSLDAAIDKIPYPPTSDTHTSTALKFAAENGFTAAAGQRPHVPNILIVITDGIARPAEFNPKNESDKIHKSNIEVFSIGVGNQISQQELEVIATDQNHVYTVKDHLDLHLPLRHIRCENFKTLPPTTATSTIKTTTATPSPTTTRTTTTSTTTRTTTTSTEPPTTTIKSVECMGCKRIARPHDCKETIKCAEHETCSTDFYITPEGHAFYDLGCRAKRVCDAIKKFGKRENNSIRKRQDENLYICQDCCNTQHCNINGCSDKSSLNRTLCYSCLDVTGPDQCDLVSACDIDKQCYARHFITDMFEERWTLGCEDKRKCDSVAKYSTFAGHPKTRKQIGGFDALDLCYYCCNDNFCNKNDCIKGSAPIVQNSLKVFG